MTDPFRNTRTPAPPHPRQSTLAQAMAATRSAWTANWYTRTADALDAIDAIPCQLRTDGPEFQFA